MCTEQPKSEEEEEVHLLISRSENCFVSAPRSDTHKSLRQERFFRPVNLTPQPNSWRQIAAVLDPVVLYFCTKKISIRG